MKHQMKYLTCSTVVMMKILLDTCVFLWWISNDAKLSSKIRKIISQEENMIFVSFSSIWEIVIKRTLGKLEINCDFEEEIGNHNFQQLPINMKHILGVEALPLIHGDPFDRMIISQAISEDLTIITADKIISKYDVKVYK